LEAAVKRANAALDERVTLRAMALADIEDELKQEIRRRQDLERQLSTTPVPTSTTPAAAALAPAPASPALAVMLSDMEAKYDSFFLAVTSGRTPNLAQMADFKSLIARCRKAAGG